MFWRPHTEFILPWNNHSLIEAYIYPEQPIFYLPIGYYLDMEYHPQYWEHLHNLKVIQEVHNHQYLLHFHRLITLLQGEIILIV